MQKSTSGFTIIELIVVIIVIGIIAAIVIISYNGIQTATLNQQRGAEILGWRASFEKYKAANGEYPAMANGGYCLGVGFPDGKCRDYASSTNHYFESNSTTLMTALANYDPPAAETRTPVTTSSGASVGPYVDFATSTISLSTAIAGAGESDCPTGTFLAWNSNTGRLVCRITLTK
jgi:prepilin-type N-terminal cleavage/methylation domain-containing protein